MKFKSSIFLLLFSAFLIIDCDSLSDDNLKVAEDIISTLNAETGELFFRKYLTNSNPGEEYYVELTLNNIPLINAGEADPKTLASFCAHQLYEKLDKTTINRNFGYEIKFKGKIDKSYFFKKSEVEIASKGIYTVSQYYKAIKLGDLENATDFLGFENQKTELDITKEISSKIKSLKEFPIHFFGDYTDVSENDSWLIISYLNLNKEDYFMTKSLINKSEPNKITYLEIQ